MDSIKILLASVVRKLVFSAGAVWIAKLVEQGVLTNADVDRAVEIAMALALIGGSALWSYIKRKISPHAS